MRNNQLPRLVYMIPQSVTADGHKLANIFDQGKFCHLMQCPKLVDGQSSEDFTLKHCSIDEFNYVTNGKFIYEAYSEDYFLARALKVRKTIVNCFRIFFNYLLNFDISIYSVYYRFI